MMVDARLFLSVSSHRNGILWLHQELANVQGVTLVMHRHLRLTILQGHLKVRISSVLPHLLDTILTMMLRFLIPVEDLSVSKDSDVNPSNGNGQRISKQDMEELEAYRASFGFSADEVVTTSQYVEITHINDDSFTMRPHSSLDLTSSNSNTMAASEGEGLKLFGSEMIQEPLELYNDHIRGHVSGSSTLGNGGQAKITRKYKMGLCSSDAEIDYRRNGRSKGDFACHD